MTDSKKKSEEIPEYSALRSLPSRGVPADLSEAEASEPYQTNREGIERELLAPPRRPLEDVPLFTIILESNGSGLVTFTLPEHIGKCLPVFSTPFRAADYVQTVLTTGADVSYVNPSPLQLVNALRAVEAAGVESLALDRCPRCSTFTTVGLPSLRASDQLIDLWCIFKATQLARENLYFSYAQDSARVGKFETARDVALEAVAHVNLEDPRPHLLLGQLAVKLGDQELLRESRAYLRFLKLDRWERKLDEVVRSEAPDFENPA
jgi:hypothetical protein